MAQRNDKIDFCKGLLILGVVYGHTVTALKGDAISAVWLHQFVRTFDMPLFMLLSGYFLSLSMAKSFRVAESVQRTDTPIRFMEKFPCLSLAVNRTSQILLPVFIWNILFYYLNALLFGGTVSLTGLFHGMTNLWFLWAVWVSSVLTVIVAGIVRKKGLAALLLLLLVLSLHFVNHNMWNLAYMLPFFALGFSYKDAVSLMDAGTLRRLKILAIVIFVLCQCFWDAKYVVWNTKTYFLSDPVFMTKACLFRFCIGLTGCVTMMLVYGFIYDVLTVRKNRFSELVCRFGRNTLALYILQSFLVENCLKQYAGHSFSKWLSLLPSPWLQNLLFGYVAIPIMAFLLTWGMDIITRWLKKIPFCGNYLFGCKI